MYFDDGFIPEPTHNKLDEITPLATFISKRMCMLKRTISTSVDVEEQIEAVCNLILCQSSLSLLSLAYLTEDYGHIEQAKELYRGI